MINLTAQVNDLIERIDELRATRARVVVAICGAPASGKSTLTAELVRRLHLNKVKAFPLPMDGFHLDNEVISAMGLLARKGAPETFDAPGYIELVRRVREGKLVYAPKFDRDRDISIAGAIAVPQEAEVIIAEGNYLMFDEDPWRELAGLWDLTVRWDVPLPELRARLIQRWLDQNLSRTAAVRRAEGNDIPNAQRILEAALPCDITLDGTPRT